MLGLLCDLSMPQLKDPTTSNICIPFLLVTSLYPVTYHVNHTQATRHSTGPIKAVRPTWKPFFAACARTSLKLQILVTSAGAPTVAELFESFESCHTHATHLFQVKLPIPRPAKALLVPISLLTFASPNQVGSRHFLNSFWPLEDSMFGIDLRPERRTSASELVRVGPGDTGNHRDGMMGFHFLSPFPMISHVSLARSQKIGLNKEWERHLNLHRYYLTMWQ